MPRALWYLHIKILTKIFVLGPSAGHTKYAFFSSIKRPFKSNSMAPTKTINCYKCKINYPQKHDFPLPCRALPSYIKLSHSVFLAFFCTLNCLQLDPFSSTFCCKTVLIGSQQIIEKGFRKMKIIWQNRETGKECNKLFYFNTSQMPGSLLWFFCTCKLAYWAEARNLTCVLINAQSMAKQFLF